MLDTEHGHRSSIYLYLDILQHPLLSIMCSVRVSVVLKKVEKTGFVLLKEKNFKLKERYILYVYLF